MIRSRNIPLPITQSCLLSLIPYSHSQEAALSFHQVPKERWTRKLWKEDIWKCAGQCLLIPEPFSPCGGDEKGHLTAQGQTGISEPLASKTIVTQANPLNCDVPGLWLGTACNSDVETNCSYGMRCPKEGFQQLVCKPALPVTQTALSSQHSSGLRTGGNRNI